MIEVSNLRIPLSRLDGTLECEDIPHTIQMLDLFLQDGSLLREMCDNIDGNNRAGLYNGAYEAVKLAMGKKDK